MAKTPKVRDSDSQPKRHVRMDSGDAFLRDPEGGPARAPDELAESLAEEFVAGATSAEGQGEDDRNDVTIEEIGGPFVETTAEEEFADDIDETNPVDAEREPFPKTASDS